MSIRFAYYGDDFTGSTDALEALAAHGVRTVLFLGVPAQRHFRQFADYEAIGVAGESRSRSPEWMDRELPKVFAWLRNLGAPVVQYKVCSTFDSSPQIGNISRAMSIGREAFGTECVFVVVAAPHLRRYVVFGNLFAAAGEAIYRIDRHPTMSHHPLTPMQESDLRLHLLAQGEPSPELLDILALTGPNPNAELDRSLTRKPSALIFDGLDSRTALATGRLLWERRQTHGFMVGSAGLTRSLIEHWRELRLVPEQYPLTPASAVDRVIVMSGSCSPLTATQIEHSKANGFDALHIADSDNEQLLRQGLECLARGRSLVVYSALGPTSLRGSLSSETLGRHLGSLLRDLIVRSGVRRAIIAGGDTSSHAMGQLGIHALTFAAVLAPGAPLCRAHSDDPAMDTLELVLKGGQVGSEDFFERVRKGQ
jgi:uncharacterized protein YgbK (DUF1537 family)